MQIIPVIDLMHGQVVHAKYGTRNQYQPVQSKLCFSSKPMEIVASLMKLYPFQALYIADIDAIQGANNHRKQICEICQNWPDITILLDSGIRYINMGFANIKPVIGSESIGNIDEYLSLCDTLQNKHILSLDFNAQGALGIAELHHIVDFWPNEVICMSLNMVGSEQGADLSTLKCVLKLNQTRHFPSAILAAGGVRNIQDIIRLNKLGVKGVLLASALHQGKITADDISQFYSRFYM